MPYSLVSGVCSFSRASLSHSGCWYALWRSKRAFPSNNSGRQPTAGRDDDLRLLVDLLEERFDLAQLRFTHEVRLYASHGHTKEWHAAAAKLAVGSAAVTGYSSWQQPHGLHRPPLTLFTTMEPSSDVAGGRIATKVARDFWHAP
eukprot:2163718-Prymnesium_polylepis.3